VKTHRFLRSIEATAVVLFFLQAIRVLFSVLFGIIYDAVFEGPFTLDVVVIHGLVLLALLTPLAAPRNQRMRWTALLVAAVLVFLARIPVTLNDPTRRLYGALLIIAASGVYIGTLLRERPRIFPAVVVAALVADQLLRALGNTWDVTLRTEWWSGQVVASLLLCGLAGLAFRMGLGQKPSLEERWLGLLGGLAIGAFLFLETSLLAFPNALARWSGINYALLAPLLLFFTLLPLLPGSWFWIEQVLARTRLSGLLVMAFTLLGLAGGYRLTGMVATAGLLLAQLLLLLTLPSALASRRDRVGGGLAAGLVLFLLLNFAYAFAFTYPYTLDFFRGAGLPVVLIAALLATLPTVLQPRQTRPAERRASVAWTRLNPQLVAGVAAILVLALLCAAIARPPALRLVEAGPVVRAATYNIHYGYNTPWQLSLEEQAQAIAASGADLVALQEVDTGRPTSYMIDDALWLGRRLGMEAVYLPTVEHLTGIALLSRFPLVSSSGRLVTSRLEQTGVVWAKVTVGKQTLDAYGVWLGLEPEERATQIGEVLAFIGEREGAAILGGDFNSPPDSPVYARIAASGFADPFAVLRLGNPPTSPAIEPQERIDFVWLRGLQPTNAQVMDSLASDHRLVVVEGTLE